MKPRRFKTLVVLLGALVAFVVIASLVTLREPLLRSWYTWRLERASEETQWTMARDFEDGTIS